MKSNKVYESLNHTYDQEVIRMMFSVKYFTRYASKREGPGKA